MIVFLSGCTGKSHPHRSFIENKDYNIKKYPKATFTEKAINPPYKGTISSNGVVKAGDGLTHKTKDKDGNIIYHFFLHEVLKNPSFLFLEEKGIIGKCKIYYVVDPKTNIIINWGFEKESNPKACRISG